MCTNVEKANKSRPRLPPLQPPEDPVFHRRHKWTLCVVWLHRLIARYSLDKLTDPCSLILRSCRIDPPLYVHAASIFSLVRFAHTASSHTTSPRENDMLKCTVRVKKLPWEADLLEYNFIEVVGVYRCERCLLCEEHVSGFSLTGLGIIVCRSLQDVPNF